SHPCADTHALSSAPPRRSSDLLGWEAEPMLRLAAIVPPDAMRVSAMAERLKMSNAETQRLTSWAAASPVHHTTSEAAMAKIAYRSEEHTSELQSRENLVCRLLL